MSLHVNVAVGLIAYSLGMILLLQYQIHKLRCNDTNSAVTGGLVRLLSGVLEAKNKGGLVHALETARFRTIRLCLFTADGEVVMDSAEPCATDRLDPIAPSTRQAELLRAVEQQEKSQPQSHLHPITGTLFRPCSARDSEPQLASFAALRMSDKSLLVASACGHES